MPAYTLRIGEKSFWIDARSDEGAVGLTAASLVDEMSGDDEILLKTAPNERVVLSATIRDMRGVPGRQGRGQSTGNTEEAKHLAASIRS